MYRNTGDYEEVAQDAIALAARMLHNTEINGKKVTAGNIAYYALQHAKSGRRSVGFSNKEFRGEDVLALVMKQPEWKSNLRAMREKHTRTFAN